MRIKYIVNRHLREISLQYAIWEKNCGHLVNVCTLWEQFRIQEDTLTNDTVIFLNSLSRWSSFFKFVVEIVYCNTIGYIHQLSI